MCTTNDTTNLINEILINTLTDQIETITNQTLFSKVRDMNTYEFLVPLELFQR